MPRLSFTHNNDGLITTAWLSEISYMDTNRIEYELGFEGVTRENIIF